ncbi:MAG: hypothetical protein Kow0098_27510 [Ignavibacteriaceae bacterium]
MKRIHYLVILGIIVLGSSIIFGQTNVSGKIIYSNGQVLNFFNMETIHGDYEDGSGLTGLKPGEVTLEYNGTKRSVSLDKINNIQVVQFQVVENVLKNVLLTIKMKNGIEFDLYLKKIVALFRVSFLDDLTGEISKQPLITFGKNGKLNIREIQFD